MFPHPSNAIFKPFQNMFDIKTRNGLKFDNISSGGIVIFLGLSVTQNKKKMSFGFMKEWWQQQCIALTIDDQCYKTVDLSIINIRPRILT